MNDKLHQRSIRRGVALLTVVVTVLGVASSGLFTARRSDDAPTTPATDSAKPTPGDSPMGGIGGSSGGGHFDIPPRDHEGTVPEPEWAGYQKYRRRCEKLDLAGARGRVVYEPRKEMTRGDPDVVRAAVTFDLSTPPNQILRSKAADEPGLVVSCHVRAQLSVSEYEFELNDKRWMERSLLTSSTARWHWYVTPKLGGTHNLILRVHPVMRTRIQGPTAKSFDLVSAENANVQEYETSIHVKVPWSERPQEAMSRLAVTFKIAEGLVTALTSLVMAVLALAAVLGVRKWRRRRA